ncbi:MAG TPA: hypothetical protein V6C89_02600 [Drouetiella sp.]
MNANAYVFNDLDSALAESIMLRSIEESLPDLWIVEDLDIREAIPDEEFMLEWRYPGKCNVQGIVPEVDITETARTNQNSHQGLAAQVPRSQLVARGILSGGRTIKSDY